MGAQCFMLHRTGRAWRSLRRYSNGERNCPGPFGYHNGQGPTEVVSGYSIVDDRWHSAHDDEQIPATDDPRWPQKCDHCDYAFQEGDHRMWFIDHIYVTDAGAEHSLRDAPPGAMWDCWYYPECWRGPDGLALMVVCPNGRQWLIDGQASNCTMKEDVGPFETAHRCWVRRGNPPNVTVDKAGRTCAAGAGSIQAGDYHGFLIGGVFS